MEPDPALKGATGVIVLNSHSPKHSARPIVHANGNREAVLAHWRAEQFARRRVEPQAIGDAIELCARDREAVIPRNDGALVIGRPNHLLTSCPRGHAVEWKLDRAAACAACTVRDSRGRRSTRDASHSSRCLP